jgi:hypothetical protein
VIGIKKMKWGTGKVSTKLEEAEFINLGLLGRQHTFNVG